MEDIVVELQTGLVRGIVEKHVEDFNYYAFKGVPYAEPPIGELRFEDPVPKKKWQGILDCKNYSPMCLQKEVFSEYISHNEDCLYLNVFTRAIGKSNASRAVMVVIHGGAFITSSGDDFIHGPDYMMRKDVVLVTVNYRLGILGFLSLEDEIAPGNQGVRDILMALNWLQQNIRAFGGDPGNVTVLGIGTSGATAHLLALSPPAKGLVHKVISQGGCLFNSWAIVPNPKSQAIKFCSLLGKKLTDSREILAFLKSLDAKILLETQEKFRLSLESAHFPFCLAVDSKSPNPILPVDRYAMADQRIEIPYLTGYAANEGVILMWGEICHSGMSREEFFELCDKDFRCMFKFNALEILERYSLTTEQIRRLYYGDEKVSNENLKKFVDFGSDLHFVEGVHKLARSQAERYSAPTYMYKFSFASPLSLMKLIVKDAPDGAAHYDEMPYLFKTRALESVGAGYYKKGTREYKLMDRMTEMWTNFAKYGKPTVETSDLIPVHWQPVDDGTNLRYLNIDEDITMQSTVNVDQKLKGAKNL